MFINQSPTICQILSNLINCLKANQCIDGGRWKKMHPFHNLPIYAGGENWCVRFGYNPLIICNHVRGQVSGSIQADTIDMIDTSQLFKNKYWTKNLKDILYHENQSTEVNKSEHPTGTLATTFHKPAGEENQYVWFGYIPQTIF